MEEGRILSEEEKAAVMRGEYRSKEADEVEKKDESQKEEQVEKEEVQDFDFGVFEKRFGRKIEKEDDIKALFEKADKYEQTNQSYSDVLKELDEYKGMAEKLDPLANFLNEDEFRRQQLLIKRKDELTEDAVKALSVLTPSKVKELSDESALKMQLMIDKGLTEREAELYLFNKYGIDDFSDEIDERTKVSIKVDAKDARASVSKLYDGIELPKKTDISEARTQLKQSWERAIPELVKSIDKIPLEDGVDFVVTDDMKKGLDSYVESLIMSKQIKPSEAAGAELRGHLIDRILINNIGSVVKSMKADLMEQVKAENRAYLHNDKPIDEGNRRTGQDLDNDAKMSKILG